MRIYNRKDFLELPAGTIYADGCKWAITGFHIKGSTIRKDDGEAIDWFYVNLVDTARGEEDIEEAFEKMLNEKISYPINVSQKRDGCFNDEDYFLVFEVEDLKIVRKYINLAIGEENG